MFQEEYIYIYIIKNRITFKIKTEYYLKLLTTETMELLGSTKSKIVKAENGEKKCEMCHIK